MTLLREYVRFVLLEKIETDLPSSMIAAYPDSSSIDKIIKFRKSLDIPKGVRVLPAEELHCTIRWWKGERHLDGVIPFLNSLEFDKVKCKVSRLEKLGDSLVMMLDSSALNKAFKKIDKGIKKAGVPPSDYPEFKAHISLYGGEVEHEAPDINVPFKFVALNKIRLVDQDDVPFWES